MTRARQLWKGATQHERLLWRHLRNRQLQGWKFRRQHPVDRYIIDFYCPEVSDSASPLGERIKVRSNPRQTFTEATQVRAEIYLELGSWRIGLFD